MPRGRPLDAAQEILEEFDRAGEITEYLVAAVPARLWHLPSPAGRGRTIAAIVTHMHGVRKTFAKMGGVTGLAALDRKTVAPADARRASTMLTTAARSRCARVSSGTTCRPWTS